MTNIAINLHFNEIIRKDRQPRNYFPLSGNTLVVADHYRKQGYTAELDGNLLTIRTTYGTVWQYVVTYDIDNHSHYAMMHRSNENSRRFWYIADNIVEQRLSRLVKYINRKSW